MENRQTPCPSGCDRALEMAIVTHPDQRDAALMDRLDAVAGRVLKPAG
jgi:5'-methylthioadenosine phosphorylase